MSSFLDEYTESTDMPFVERTIEVVPSHVSSDDAYNHLGSWDEVVVASVEDLIDLALIHPPRRFIAYLTQRSPWCGALISTTSTHDIVFGVSVNDPMNDPEPIEQATRLLDDLRAIVNATHGWAIHEEAPPFDPHGVGPWDDSRTIVSFAP